MPIKFKVIRKTQPGVINGGSKKYYASGISNGEMDLEALTEAIEKISTISGADIRGTLYALVRVTADALAQGYIVRLGDIGSLRISLRSEGSPHPEAVTAKSIKGSKILFSPGAILKKMQQLLRYEKA